MENVIRSLLRKDYITSTFEEILLAPVAAFIGVGTHQSRTLKYMEIITVKDLATNVAFAQAFEICHGHKSVNGAVLQNVSTKIPNDANILGQLTTLSGLDKRQVNRLEKFLDIKSIPEMADWGPYNMSRYILIAC